jgi:hypothetical protein
MKKWMSKELVPGKLYHFMNLRIRAHKNFASGQEAREFVKQVFMFVDMNNVTKYGFPVHCRVTFVDQKGSLRSLTGISPEDVIQWFGIKEVEIKK